MKRWGNKYGRYAMVVLALACVLLCGKNAYADDEETTILRVISTTDIHDSINSENYDVGGKNNTRSLAKLNTMIKTARSEIKQGNSITVDAGDSVYGYGAETIMGSVEKPSNNLQPVFTAISKVGYDAITLGNHEFDYGYGFITNQISQAGLDDICLVANVKEWSTGKYPWQKTKMITKELETSSGNRVSVKIGIIGVTHSELSTYYDYNGILKTDSTLKTVRTLSADLKKKGADIVVVVSHCGMGNNKSDDTAADVGYAMTKISTVDCVMLGHQHRNYPSDDASAQLFYKLPNIDKENGLTNGKPVVMVADHAAGIGIADLTLKVTDGKVSIAGAKTEVRKCSALVMPDPEIENVTETYDSLIKGTYNEILAGVATGSAITGYFGPFEDNYAVQLNNEAKIRFGMNFIHSVDGQKYANYPVIAATRYYMDGSEGKDDYIEVGHDFTMKDVLNTQEYQHNNNYAYWITGKQLKEWIEWSASIYAKTDEKITSDDTLSTLMSQWNAASVLSQNWTNDWHSFTVFDGLEYEIDASKLARYDDEGSIVQADAERVKKLTYNGQAVTDDMKFIIVDNYISKNQAVINALYNQRLTKKEYRCTYYMKNYVRELGKFGAIEDQADHNWSVSFGDKANYIVKSSSLSEMYAMVKPWYKRTLKVTDDYAYYLADMAKSAREEDIYGPLLVLSPSATVETNDDITIYAQASDASGVKEIRYQEGQVEKDADSWDSAASLTDNKLMVSKNGIYSFCAVDLLGNKTVKYIEISNINPNVLQIPTIDKFSNKKTILTGKAQAGVTVHVTINGKTYNTTATKQGTYSCTVSKQMAGKKISVYVSDNKGRKSAAVESKVLRRGPNAPSLNTVTNKTVTLSGNLNDKNSTVVVYMGNKAYVPKSNGASLYKKCAKYNKAKKITTTSYSVKNGKYYVKVPVPAAKTKISIFSVDSDGTCSLATQQATKEAAPNQPRVDAICEVERYVSGKIPAANKVCKVIVRAGGKTYTAKSKKSGRFVVNTKGFSSGTVVSVTASDTQNGKTRTSLSTKRTVDAESKYVTSAPNSKITVRSIDNRSLEIKGKVKSKDTDDVYVSYGDTSAKLDINKDGSFSYTLISPLDGGTKIYVSRHNKTSGNTEEIKKTVVQVKKPQKPELIEKKLSVKAKKMTLAASEKATVIVKVKGKTIKSKKCTYSTKRGAFIYRLKIPKGTGKVRCYVRNSLGTSKAVVIDRR